MVKSCFWVIFQWLLDQIIKSFFLMVNSSFFVGQVTVRYPDSFWNSPFFMGEIHLSWRLLSFLLFNCHLSPLTLARSQPKAAASPQKRRAPSGRSPAPEREVVVAFQLCPVLFKTHQGDITWMVQWTNSSTLHVFFFNHLKMFFWYNDHVESREIGTHTIGITHDKATKITSSRWKLTKNYGDFTKNIL